MILLHIGRHKTGTTSIQKFLFKNRHTLKKDNIIYFNTDKNLIAHHHIPRKFKEYLPNPFATWKYARKINREILKETEPNLDSIFIISSEAFQNVDPRIVKKLFENSNHDIKVLCYFRDPVSYYLSSYKQLVHAELVDISFSEYVQKHPKLSEYETFINKWKSNFDNMVIKQFERKKMFKNDLIQDFFSVLDVELKEINLVQEDVNPSLNGFGTLLKLLINNLVISKEIDILREGQLYYNLPKIVSEFNFDKLKHLPLAKEDMSIIIQNSSEAFKIDELKFDSLESENIPTKYEINDDLISNLFKTLELLASQKIIILDKKLSTKKLMLHIEKICSRNNIQIT